MYTLIIRILLLYLLLHLVLYLVLFRIISSQFKTKRLRYYTQLSIRDMSDKSQITVRMIQY